MEGSHKGKQNVGMGILVHNKACVTKMKPRRNTATMLEDLFAYNDDVDVASETVSLPHMIGTESDGSSMHMPDSLPAGFVINDPYAEAFAALSRHALRLCEHLHRAETAQHSVATDEAAIIAIAKVHGQR